jgi:phosphoribosyl 1,2-cyclic phosphodiesterase
VQFWAFASGSSGNCYLLESEHTRLLIECGRPVSQVGRYLDGCGLEPAQLDGILLTHAHGDHSRAARELSDLYEVPVYASAGTLANANFLESKLGRPMEHGRSVTIGDVEVHPFRVPHDCAEPFGFRFESSTGRACFLTDLGWVPAATQAQLSDLDLLIIEANYDPRLLFASDYPRFLKQRVASSHGHLSNLDAAQAIVACGERPPLHVWLAHLSETSNTSRHALRTVGTHLRRHGLGHIPVRATRQRRPSLHWNSFESAAKQLSLW